MAEKTYDIPSTYARILAAAQAEEGCGCENSSSCTCEKSKCKDDKCGCCSPGLVEVFDADGRHLSCLTPNDAELYMAVLDKHPEITCDAGYVKTFDADGKFLGCLTVEDYVAYKAV